MIVRNLTKDNLSFEACGRRFHLGPKGAKGFASDTSLVGEDAKTDPTITHLVERGMVAVEDTSMPAPEMPQKTVEVVEQKVVEAEKKERVAEVPNSGAEPHTMKVVQATRDLKRKKRVVQCAATTAAGNRCSSKVYVDGDEFDPEQPYFCKRHSGESADNYEKTETGWKKKA